MMMNHIRIPAAFCHRLPGFVCIRRSSSRRKASKNSYSRSVVALESHLKRRTRSTTDFDHDLMRRHNHDDDDDDDDVGHVPVLLGEVLSVFRSPTLLLRSFVDCTLGAAGHSAAIIEGHPEMRVHIGMDVDPTALEKGRSILNDGPLRTVTAPKSYTFLRNFKHIMPVLGEVDGNLLVSGVDGILMDLGMSSMQVNNPERGFSVLYDGPLDMRMDPKATLRAEDILNSWPETELGRILREYGEESNWRHLQNKIVKARLGGGLHSTSELVSLVQKTSSAKSGGRQGWIKTATRVFQALRIAVNDELKTLEDSLYACFNCLSSGGRLAVISFHSLEDRIVKKTFLDIIEKGDGNENADRESFKSSREVDNEEVKAWSKQRVIGKYGTILTKRPITPTVEEENMNRRSRSAKLRVIQKL
ncbi:hypothetical protein QJS04_geneDACA004186 [Acorus gramineus]|uniref:Uncharacterized protein n=1 Tax=Acorus gramineus TaxID=55184 RepID=A0AAV9BJS2_ACOGR|nr:hypothetical protein QJS04_geneDACA004186 [Acorus gramineus]